MLEHYLMDFNDGALGIKYSVHKHKDVCQAAKMSANNLSLLHSKQYFVNGLLNLPRHNKIQWLKVRLGIFRLEIRCTFLTGMDLATTTIYQIKMALNKT